MSSSVPSTKKGETVKTGSDPGLNDSERGGEAGDIEAGQRIKGIWGKKIILRKQYELFSKKYIAFEGVKNVFWRVEGNQSHIFRDGGFLDKMPFSAKPPSHQPHRLLRKRQDGILAVKPHFRGD